MQEAQQTSQAESFRNGLGILIFLAQSLAATVEVFLHRSDSFGERYLGLRGLGGMLCILFFPIFWEGNDPTGLLYFLSLYLVLLLCIRGAGLARRRRGGPQPHSFYTGRPRVMRLVGRRSEQWVKCVLEPLMVFLAGIFTMPLDEPLAGYLMLASAGLLVSTNLTVRAEHRRAMDMNDAFLEQRDVVERFRGMRGE